MMIDILLIFIKSCAWQALVQDFDKLLFDICSFMTGKMDRFSQHLPADYFSILISFHL